MNVPNMDAYNLVRELDCDEERLYFINNHLLDFEYDVASYILAFDSDCYKFECLSYLSNEYYISLVIDSMKSEDFIARVVCSLPLDFSFSFIKSKFNNFKLISKIFMDGGVINPSSYESARNRFKMDNFDGSCLPSDMSFGIELEVVGGNSKRIRYFDVKPFGSWDNVVEESLCNNSVEITSPILHYTQKDMAELAAVCNFLKSNNAYVDESCAGHIHIGLNSFKSVKALANFYELYYLVEPAVYLMSNKLGELPRKEYTLFAASIKENYKDSLINNITKYDDFNEALYEIYTSLQMNHKYWSVNIGSLFSRLCPKDTIEFRMPNGSLEADDIMHNMRLFGNLVAISNVIDRESIDKLRSLNWDDRVIYLLKLLFNDLSDREYFYERWINNYDLMLRFKPDFKKNFIEDGKRELLF